MEILKIICIAVIGALIFLYLKSNNSELSGITAVTTGILIIILTVDYISETVAFFSKMASTTGVSSELFVLIVKIVAISYLADFSSSLCEDLGAKSIGDKVNFASRLIVFVLSLPILSNLLTVVSSLIL